MAEPDRSIGFVETHYHLWELGRLRYAWLDEPGVDAKTTYLGDYRELREDWPVASLYGSYGEQVDAYRTIIAEAGFSATEQRRLLGQNAERIYRI